MNEKNKSYDIAVIGGGASGIVAAISARRAGASVLLCEKNRRLGKKVRASGNGRCNLLNETLDSSFYNPEAKPLVDSVLARFGKQEALRFFKELGLAVFSDKGRIFPATNQAASVMEVLEMELSRAGAHVEYEAEVISLDAETGGFKMMLKNGFYFYARRVLLCGGGKSYPISGSDGKAYDLALRFGHRLIEPVPSTVALLSKDPWCAVLQGQKMRVAVRWLVGGQTGPRVDGELIFADNGISGTAVLDSSEEISIAINRQGAQEAALMVDFLPLMHEDQLRKEISLRLKKKFPPEKLLIGILPAKFSLAMADVLKKGDPHAIASRIKEKEFIVTGTRGWEEAEFTAGGIDTRQVDTRTLESKCQQGFYFAGEILDVQGRRGGYNLGWAWASGFVAGEEAARGIITA